MRTNRNQKIGTQVKKKKKNMIPCRRKLKRLRFQWARLILGQEINAGAFKVSNLAPVLPKTSPAVLVSAPFKMDL